MNIKKFILLFMILIENTCSYGIINIIINKYNILREINYKNNENINIIKYCSKLSNNVYIDKGNLTDYKYTTKIKLVENNKDIYICFKGSSNLKDWKTNLDKSLSTYKYDTDIFSIHKGYSKRYYSISKNIHLYFKNKSYDNVYVCGHSLGGALAVICCFDIVINKVIDYKKIHCITFGAPRVGDRNFSKIYNNLNIKTNRIVLSGDPVPKLPLDGNYVHTESSIYFKNNKVYNKPRKFYIAIKRFLTNICKIDYTLKNHSIKSYINELNKY